MDDSQIFVNIAFALLLMASLLSFLAANILEEEAKRITDTIVPKTIEEAINLTAEGRKIADGMIDNLLSNALLFAATSKMLRTFAKWTSALTGIMLLFIVVT